MSDSEHDGARLDDELESTRPFTGKVRSTSAINGYTVIRKLGAGSAGDVYEAWQAEPVRRVVALKLIRTGLDPEAVLSHFESEREALARMNHSNIAQGTGKEPLRPFALDFDRVGDARIELSADETDQSG